MTSGAVLRRPQSEISLFWLIVGVLQLSAAAFFLFRPTAIFWMFNLLPAFLSRFEAIPEPSEGLGLVMTMTVLVIQASFSLMICFRPKIKIFALLQFLTCTLQVLGLLYLYAHLNHYLAYLLVMVAQSFLGLMAVVRLGRSPI